MIDATVAKVKGFLIKPVEAFQQTKDDEPKTVFVYFAVLVFIYSLLTALIGTLALNATFVTLFPAENGIFVVFISTFIVSYIAILIVAAWLHLWVYVLGGRNSIMQTMKAIVYGSTPHLLLGWIPFIGILFSLWALMCSILGVRELQNLSTGKAAAVFVIAFIIPVILFVLFAIIIGTFIVGAPIESLEYSTF